MKIKIFLYAILFLAILFLGIVVLSPPYVVFTPPWVHTATPHPTDTALSIPLTINVPGLLGNTVSEVEIILGSAMEVDPINDGNLVGGEYRDYQIDNYYVFIGYDETGIARMFQVLEGLSSMNYSTSQWAMILPIFGVNNTTSPDQTAPAAVYWDNYNGLFIAIMATSSSGKPVWTVQIAQIQYRP